MPNSIDFNPFLWHSRQLHELLKNAQSADNPALYLYQKGARNIVFMLEGLTRIHKNAFEDENMDKWYDRFKKIEDLFGQIDYLDAFKKQFETDQVLDEKAIAELGRKTAIPIAELNQLLEEKEWFKDKLLKFDAFIESCGFRYDQSYTACISAAYSEEIQKIEDFAKAIHFEIKELEIELHELRRRLRWLSIYPQAFRGLFQLKRGNTDPVWSKKYMTEKIVNSPFNQLPPPVENLPAIYLDYHCFIALSFMIQEYGGLKDQGLQSFVLADELSLSESETEKVLRDKYVSEKVILTKATALLKAFFKDNILQNLVQN